METIIGRLAEIKKLTSTLNSPRAEFIALYGRRRVGKTFARRKSSGKMPSISFVTFSAFSTFLSLTGQRWNSNTGHIISTPQK